MSIEVVEVPEVKAMTSSATNVPVDDVGATLARIYGAVFGHVMGHGGAPAGQPFARYEMAGDHLFNIKAGIPVAEHVQATDSIQQSSLPGGPAAKSVHVGPYDTIEKAHAALHEWIDVHGRECVGNPWEIYVTDPGQEPDSSKWVTEIYYPLAAT
jgi:AraC family transcriptional regulator